MEKIVYLVLQVKNFETKTFEVTGIFDTEEMAKSVCCGDNYFIAFMEVNKRAPIESVPFDGYYHNNLT